MIEIATKILDAFCLLIRLLRTGGSYGLVAEVLLLRQQLLVLNRGKKKCPPLITTDRLIMGICTLVMTPKRIGKSAIAIAESTLLNFHRALEDRKYSRLFSKKTRSKPGPKGPSKELIKLVVETKERNPSYGCPWRRARSISLN
jgi:putative transposase